MPDDDIRRLKATRKIQTRFTLKAPIDGVITAFDLRAGMNIAKDNVVAKIPGHGSGVGQRGGPGNPSPG